MTQRTRTIVLNWDSEDSGANEICTKALSDVSKYVTCMSMDDECTLLEMILEHEDFPSHIEKNARDAVEAMYKEQDNG